MNAEKILKQMEDYHYWDARVLSLECNYFADEVTLVHEDEVDSNILYHFEGCYKVVFDHVKAYDKLMPARSFGVGHVPYFMQDVKVGTVTEDDITFYTCVIDSFPLDIEIWCQNITVTKVAK